MLKIWLLFLETNETKLCNLFSVLGYFILDTVSELDTMIIAFVFFSMLQIVIVMMMRCHANRTTTIRMCIARASRK